MFLVIDLDFLKKMWQRFVATCHTIENLLDFVAFRLHFY